MDNKFDRIAQLQDDNAASLAEIARREEERAANPELDIVQKYNEGEPLVYKVTETPEREPTPAAPAVDGDTYMEATAGFVVSYVTKKLAERDARIAKLEAKLETLTELLRKKIIT
jgi:hypothetical protein